MKKNSLTTAIIAGVAGVAGLAGVAQAVNLNPDGIGQVLLYPYYTTNGGNTTLFTVVNTADVGKAVKVRFLESLNSKEVLDFNVYMSPFDVWTAAIFDNAGVAGIQTQDTTCVAPNKVMTQFTPFRNFEFTNWLPDLLGRSTDADSVAKNESRKRQGHVEVIEMGDLGGLAHANSKHGLYGGVWKPKDCSYFETQWASNAAGTWLNETGGVLGMPNYGRGLHDVYAPGSGYVDPVTGLEFRDVGGIGGIFGSAYIVNAAQGTAYSYNAEAINGFYSISDVTTGVASDRNLHYAPGTPSPSLFHAANAYDSGLKYAIARVFDAAGNPTDLAFQTGSAPEAVSAVLMARYVANEYAIGGSSEALTDWVITFPTKQLHTYRSPVGSTTAAGLAPFSVAQGSGFLNNEGDNEFMGSWAEEFSMRYWDREELEPTTPPGVLDVSPLPPPGEELVLAFRQEANVLTFHTKDTDAETLLHAPAGSMGGGYAVALEEGFNEGWARIGFDSQSMTSPAVTVGGVAYPSVTLNGLPVIGFWAARHTNAFAAPGVTAYYNIIHRHRVVREQD
ncbi:MAG TPA: hypothetical protein VFN29_13655 [Chiayiivirga sp.]|nr:hypothetical protein [Chiayiivirga sp.]